MRRFPIALLASSVLVSSLLPSTARADPDPDGALALVSGAAVNLVGMIAGATVLAAGNLGNSMNNAGWYTIEAGFTLSPLVAHGVVGEWGRGAAFAAFPAAMTGATAALFTAVPNTIEHGSLGQQRVMWALFGLDLAGSVVGIVDAALAPRRTHRMRDLRIAPVVGAGGVGVGIGGIL
jgi:hypothetical protein